MSTPTEPDVIIHPEVVDIDGPPPATLEPSFDEMMAKARAPEVIPPPEAPESSESEEDEPAEQADLPGPAPAKLTKKVLVDRIGAYQAVLSRRGFADADVTAANLMRNKVADLKALHGRLERRAVQPPPQANVPAEAAAGAARMAAPQHEQLARTATGCTLILAQGVEALVNTQSDVLGVEMDGFQANLKENAGLLTEAYAEIIEEEGVDAGPFAYLGSSYARLGIVLLASASTSLRKKKPAQVSGSSWPSSEEH